MTSPAAEALTRLVVTVPDFPQAGILFRDLTPVLADPAALRAVADELVADAGAVDAVVGIEARGFVLAAAAAVAGGTGVALVRKAGKLPRPRFRREYALEYGTATLEFDGAGLAPGARVLLVDDVLATGGTLAAALELLVEAGLEVVGVAVALELTELDGRARLGDVPARAISAI
jgi:adenine phosphoribosyltransferase